MSDFNFNINLEQVLKKLASMGEVEMKMRAAVGLCCDTTGKDMQKYAKDNAPWKNHTGDARKTITGGFRWADAHKCRSYVEGNMNYSPYLELSHAKGTAGTDVGMEVASSFAQLELGNEGKYAILRPTVKKFAPELLKKMRNLFGK